MVIRYNAPVTLTFSLVCIGVLILSLITGGASTFLLFSVHSRMDFGDIFAWLRLFGHVMGHGDWDHLIGNLSFLLLLGPILEEKYGSRTVFFMIVITALVTGILHILFSALAIFGGNTNLLGASGIVFMFILLASFTNIRSGEIPLTFIAIVTLYLTREIINAFQPDNISQFAHIIGGGIGSLFGFFFSPKKVQSP